jgi:hypothetical protein
MCLTQISPEDLHSLTPVILILVLWDMVWKAIAMWRAARNNELVWFICIAVFNTLGILPIIYLILNKKHKEVKA